MKRRILFVDDEARVLDGLRRMLHALRSEWDMEFVTSGQEALDTLAKNDFDVLVTDMRMPGMDGGQVLTEVIKSHPQIVRIILSGQSDEEMVMKTIATAHQFLSKPCDSETLKATVNRAFTLRGILMDKSLKELVSQVNSLPSLPSLYVELMDALQSQETSIQKVGEIISKDIGMSAKVLQLVNSAFFGIRRHISSPAEAAMYLGLNTIKALAFSIQTFSQFDQSKLSKFSIQTLWKHSMATGALARQIAKVMAAHRRICDDALTAGLLHDVGKLILASNLSEKYDKTLSLSRAKKVNQWEAEQEIFGSTHAEVGAYLLSLWGLNDQIVEAIAFHHWPSKSPAQTFSSLTAVHAANALEREAQPVGEEMDGSGVDHDYLTKLGVLDKLPKWRTLCQDITQGGDAS